MISVVHQLREFAHDINRCSDRMYVHPHPTRSRSGGTFRQARNSTATAGPRRRH